MIKMDNIILTFASKDTMTKVFYNDKWYKASGGGYNKRNHLMEMIFKNLEYKTYYISVFTVGGWTIETIEVNIIKEEVA